MIFLFPLFLFSFSLFLSASTTFISVSTLAFSFSFSLSPLPLSPLQLFSPLSGSIPPFLPPTLPSLLPYLPYPCSLPWFSSPVWSSSFDYRETYQRCISSNYSLSPDRGMLQSPSLHGHCQQSSLKEPRLSLGQFKEAYDELGAWLADSL